MLAGGEALRRRARKSDDSDTEDETKALALELIDLRFDQQRARGLQAGLAARIVLRSQTGEPIAGLVSRVEPYADAVTEETLAKIEFKQAPASLPPLGELAEVTVALQAHKAMPVGAAS